MEKKEGKNKKNIDTKTNIKKTYSSNTILDFIMNNDKNIKIFLIGLIVGLAIFYIKDMNRVTKLSNGDELVLTASGIKMTTNDLYDSLKDKYAIGILVDELDNTLLTKKYPMTDEIQKTIDEQVKSVKEQAGDNFLATIKQYYGFNSEQELRNAIALSVRREKEAKSYIKSKITDNEINNYYNDEITGDVKASHILIKADTTDDMTDEQVTAKEKEAETLAKEIITKLNNGDDFATLAKKYSKDEGSAKNGGDLGYFNKGDMVAEFEKAVLKLKNGEYTKEPIKSTYGYHIILKVDQKEKEKLKDVKDDIITDLVDQKLNANQTLYYEALIQFRKDKKLDFIDGKLKSQYENLKSTWLTKDTSSES